MEEELEMAQVWLHDEDLLDDHNKKELPLEWTLHRFWEFSKCQFGDIVDEAQHTFLCHSLPYEDKHVAIHTDIGGVWNPKYH